MSQPMMTCSVCQRRRNCIMHIRADHPPTAAKKWLRSKCVHAEKPCDIHYTAGIEPRGSVVGQQEPKP